MELRMRWKKLRFKFWVILARLLPRKLVYECGWRIAAEVSELSLERMKQVSIWQALRSWYIVSKELKQAN